MRSEANLEESRPRSASFGYTSLLTQKTGGANTLSNCEILCKECHKNSIDLIFFETRKYKANVSKPLNASGMEWCARITRLQASVNSNRS